MCFENTASSEIEVNFTEEILANYQEIQYQAVPKEYQKIQFSYSKIGNYENYVGYKIEGS